MRKYPWDEWFKKSEIILVRGTDFVGMTHGMIQCIRNAMARPRHRKRFKKEGAKVSLKALDAPERIVITITRPEKPVAKDPPQGDSPPEASNPKTVRTKRS